MIYITLNCGPMGFNPSTIDDVFTLCKPEDLVDYHTIVMTACRERLEIKQTSRQIAREVKLTNRSIKQADNYREVRQN